MKKIFFPTLLLSFLLSACQTGTPTVRAFNDGNIITDEGKSIPIKGYGDADAVTFFIVRHADKTDAQYDPPLSEAGYTRAKRLAEILSGVPVALSTSTNFVRTTETANPFVSKNRGEISVYDPDNMTDHFEEILKTKKGQNVFVVGHSNSVPALLNLFKGKEVYNDIPETEYDNLYIATVKKMGNAKVMELKYK